MEAFQVLKEFGFPIFVCAWFMWRMEKRLEAHTVQIGKLATAVRVMSQAMDVDVEEDQ